MTDKLQAAREADGIPADPIADKAIAEIIDATLGKTATAGGNIYLFPRDIVADIAVRAYHAGQKQKDKEYADGLRMLRYGM